MLSNTAIQKICSGTPYLPPMLKYFFKCLVGSDLKQAALGQCLIKAMRPNTVIPRLLFGLDIKVDHLIGSNTLVFELAKMGYSISSDEIKRFKQSFEVQEKSITQEKASSTFMQRVGDYCDRNATIQDSKGTFHFMGIIECAIKKRMKHSLKNGIVTKTRKIEISPYTFPDH